MKVFEITKDRLRADLENNTAKELAEIYGVAQATVLQWAKECGITLRRGRPPKKKRDFTTRLVG